MMIVDVEAPGRAGARRSSSARPAFNSSRKVSMMSALNGTASETAS
jgi:hypothetical protein